jgi:ribosome-associated heat shock protein Hsp15
MRNDVPQRHALTLRLDKWLWFARMVRSRSLAARLCAAGGVSVGAHAAAKPHHPVRVGDTITVDLPQCRRVLIVRALGERRGPSVEARGLYDEATPRSPREAAPAWISLFAEDEEPRDDQRLTQSL